MDHTPETVTSTGAPALRKITIFFENIFLSLCRCNFLPRFYARKKTFLWSLRRALPWMNGRQSVIKVSHCKKSPHRGKSWYGRGTTLSLICLISESGAVWVNGRNCHKGFRWQKVIIWWKVIFGEGPTLSWLCVSSKSGAALHEWQILS